MILQIQQTLKENESVMNDFMQINEDDLSDLAIERKSDTTTCI